jgi:hypothetical protein
MRATVTQWDATARRGSRSGATSSAGQRPQQHRPHSDITPDLALMRQAIPGVSLIRAKQLQVLSPWTVLGEISGCHGDEYEDGDRPD